MSETLQAERDRAAEARHGAHCLTWKLVEALASPQRLVKGRWVPQDELIAALAGDHESITPAEAWDAIDRHIFPGERASTHVGRLRAKGFDRSRAELLDQAITWPVIRVALGLSR